MLNMVCNSSLAKLETKNIKNIEVIRMMANQETKGKIVTKNKIRSGISAYLTKDDAFSILDSRDFVCAVHYI